MNKRRILKCLFLLSTIAVLTPSGVYCDPIEVTFYGLGEMGIAYAPTGSFTDAPLRIINQTGETWTDFHLRLSQINFSGIQETVGGAIYFSEYEGPGTAVLYDPGGRTNPFYFSMIDITGIFVPDGEALEFTISGGRIGEILGSGATYVYAYPTTNGGTSVPEPSTMFLLSFGIVALVGSKLVKKNET